jgi:mannose-6-phosphate isomerase-like protein (cupin superfamily)
VRHVKQLCVLVSAAVVVTAAVGVVVAQQPARGTPPPPPEPLTTSKLLNHDAVAGCSKAGTFVNTPDYIVQCSHRTGPGVVEVHTKETDVLYVIDGSATFVTGGKALNVTATNPLQPRGTDIQGGQSHQLTKGDVIVVPAGQPHWFKEVPASVSYFVVKVVKP